ncbi:MAG: aminomethyl-transferring glycine dehydrogenase subunit GcvPB [Candidatus Hydrothermales bacterium]
MGNIFIQYKHRITQSNIKVGDEIPEDLRRKSELRIPNLTEGEIVRHFDRLGRKNYSVDYGFYPLGSCTMKYNPKLNEELASHPNFVNLHPLQPSFTVQGILRLAKELENFLCIISGMDRVTLQPAAGAHGELVGMLIVRKYHTEKGNPRKYVLVPDSAHGTNPASVTLAGYTAIEIKSNSEGLVDIEKLKELISEEVAALMITNPNTLGLFESNIKIISEMLHEKDILLYMDGANLNALLGIVRPGDTGVDILHFNLHKTFSTPHGSGGPGAGPVGVKKFLEKYLPIPRIVEENGELKLSYDFPHSIGKVHAFYGHPLVWVRALSYILRIGKENLRKIAEFSILNANYLRKKLEKYLENPYPNRPSMHEFVLSAENIKRKHNVKALDIAKRLLDYGFHAPTMYFPLIVKEALMIEPTETESIETLDEFVKTIEKIIEEIEKNPEVVINAPHTTPVKRLDEVKANKELNVRETLLD